MTADHPLRGRHIAIATMHGKERAIAPALAARFGVHAVVPAGFDTDAFGTFTGEVARRGSPRDAARAKAAAALAATGLDAAIASEGTFGPHPAAPLLPLAAEFLLLVDARSGLEVEAEDVGTATNWAGAPVRDLAEAEAFGARVGFPDHQLVLRVSGDPTATRRGIGNRDELAVAMADLLRRGGRVEASADMRADRNPTRMRAIARTAERLVERAAMPCPGCGWFGYGFVRAERGLPCEACGEPTELVRALVDGCARCAATTRRPRPDGAATADAGTCPQCNP
ncbi:MAG: DUF6671 family protein [Planctomycetota bacterium]